jgi:hypothetical protein
MEFQHLAGAGTSSDFNDVQPSFLVGWFSCCPFHPFRLLPPSIMVLSWVNLPQRGSMTGGFISLILAHSPWVVLALTSA